MKNLLMALSAVVAISTSFYTFPDKTERSKDRESDTLSIANVPESVEKTITISASDLLYSGIQFHGNVLDKPIFEKAFQGFENLKKSGKLNPDCHLLTVCDFSKSSNIKRLWVIDTDKKEILFNTLVAHGKNTGEEFAENFSNTESSYQSSLGFYITDVTYSGDNGYSLKLLGMDKGFNDNALQRAIVMHGADYVSDDFAQQHKRIGRSWGCPAIPRALAEPIINTIKDQNVLFIYYPDQHYLASSEWLK